MGPLVVDVNGDGYLDVVTTNQQSNDLSLLMGRGDGTFADERRFVLGAIPVKVQDVDVNGDGRIDLVTANFDSGDVSVLLGNGHGDFVNALSVSPIAVGATPVVEDINGDGIDDVLILTQDGAVLYRRGTRTSSRGVGRSVVTSLGEFETAVVVNPDHPARDFTLLRSPSGWRIASLDTSGNFDHDSAGLDDFALINQGTQTVTLYFADATGFHPGETFDAGAGPVSLATTDLNRDGLTDLIVPNFGSSDVSVFTNAGDRHFATALFRTGPAPYFIGPSPHDASRLESQSFDQTSSAEVEDFNGDGLPDMIATNPGSNS